MKRMGWLMLLATLLSVNLAFAQRGLGLGAGWRWDPSALKQQLGLTDEQVQKLTQLSTEHVGKVRQLATELAAKRAELRAILTAPQLDQQRVKEVTEQVSKLTAELVKERVAFQTQLRQILTPEQWSKLQQRWRAKPGLGLGPRWGQGMRGLGRGWRSFVPQGPRAFQRPGGWGRRWAW